MSKEELENLLEKYIPGCGGEWKESILDTMVAAYNKAIEDAVKLAEGDSFVYVPHVEQLKIRD